MIRVEINGQEVGVPVTPEEIKLSQYIEWNKLRQVFIAAQNTGDRLAEIIAAGDCLKKVIEMPDSLLEELTVGDFSLEDKEDTISKLFSLVDSAVIGYKIEPLALEGYEFEYKGDKWVFPCYFDYHGRPWTSLKYGQYIEAKNAIKMYEEQKEKDKDGSLEFTSMLMIMASLCRPKSRFKMVDGKYQFIGEETLLEMRMIAEGASFWEDISMQIGLSVNFFFRSLILN